MQEICNLFGMEPDTYFSHFFSTLRGTITQWDYFVNWKKVLGNVSGIEHELNLLNTLIGKSNLEEEANLLFAKYPECVKAIPALLAIRAKSLKVLVDVYNFTYKSFDFSREGVTPENSTEYVSFIVNSGLGELLSNRSIKNLVDYVVGVEVGLDSNGRKNRTGTLMESIVEPFVAQACVDTGSSYMKGATATKIRAEWHTDIVVDKSERIVDFAIYSNAKLYFIETNFYSGGGSKLKATATEYINMSSYWNKQGVTFIWITDGAGWHSTRKPVREYFDKADYLLNLSALQQGYLSRILLCPSISPSQMK